MSQTIDINLYKLISDIGISGVIALFLIVLIIFRKPIHDFFKCKKDTDNILNSVDKFIRIMDTKIALENNINKNNLEAIKDLEKDINDKLHFLSNDIRQIIRKLELKHEERDIKLRRIYEEIEDISKKLEKINKILSKYLNNEIDDV